jgi:glucosamine--fructose-6-phosphate aminotransferase (isomerizing)
MVMETHLHREIFEQPEVLANLLQREKGTIDGLVKTIRERQINHVVIAARGTSDNAARYAKYLLGAINRLPVALATPSLFSIYKRPPQLRGALVLGISQSGKSPDIVAVLTEARRQGALTATITNDTASDLSAQADYVIDLHAGAERSVAATKTYTSELAAIAMLSVTLADDSKMLSRLKGIPEVVQNTLTMETDIQRVAGRYRYMKACIVIGRGYNYCTAFELALKLKELTYTVVEPYSSADFMHGPLAMVEWGFPVVLIAPSGQMLAEIRGLIHTLKGLGAEVIAISDDPETLSLARIPLNLPVSVPEWLSPITTIIPGQLFALHLAYARDYDPDHPRGLQKITETR